MILREERQTMRNKFDREMQELNADVIKMGEFIEITILKAMEALKTSDKALAKEVAENDHKANELEYKIEKKSLKILLTEQPVAKDLRTISTALKMITDMERICDQAADIAEIIMGFEGNPAEESGLLYDMADKCVKMVMKSVESFVNHDAALASAVIDSDDEVDRLFFEVRGKLIEAIQSDSKKGELLLDYFMIAKYLERIGDHAQNIAEWVIFNEKGTRKEKRIL